MDQCLTLIWELPAYVSVIASGVVLACGYGILKLKDFWPVLKTLLSTSQDYPLGAWNCEWHHDQSSDGKQRPDIKDVVTIDFAREEIVIGSGSGGDVVDGYKLVGRCTSSSLALTYKIADKTLPFVGAVTLHKVNEKRLEGRFVQYVVTPDGLTAGLVTGKTTWRKP